MRPPLPDMVKRLQGDGSYLPANMWEDIGLLTRPIVTQVSRWDRLKGFKPLMDAFVRMKLAIFDRRENQGWEERRRMDLVRLVLAGPDPASIQDDPEGKEVLEELHAAYLELDPALQDDVALVTLPMSSARHNALIVNALQRASSVVVQNSLREGFGLTVTEAMWKRVPDPQQLESLRTSAAGARRSRRKASLRPLRIWKSWQRPYGRCSGTRPAGTRGVATPSAELTRSFWCSASSGTGSGSSRPWCERAISVGGSMLLALAGDSVGVEAELAVLPQERSKCCPSPVQQHPRVGD